MIPYKFFPYHKQNPVCVVRFNLDLTLCAIYHHSDSSSRSSSGGGGGKAFAYTWTWFNMSCDSNFPVVSAFLLLGLSAKCFLFPATQMVDAIYSQKHAASHDYSGEGSAGWQILLIYITFTLLANICVCSMCSLLIEQTGCRKSLRAFKRRGGVEGNCWKMKTHVKNHLFDSDATDKFLPNPIFPAQCFLSIAKLKKILHNTL